MIDCDLDNPELTCPRCKFDVGKIGGNADWRMNCPLGSGLPLPGTRLRLLLAPLLEELKITVSAGCGCPEYARQMDAWGIAKCRERKAEVIAHMVEQAGVTSTELPFGLDLADLLGDVFDEAMRQAEAAG